MDENELMKTERIKDFCTKWFITERMVSEASDLTVNVQLLDKEAGKEIN